MYFLKLTKGLFWLWKITLVNSKQWKIIIVSGSLVWPRLQSNRAPLWSPRLPPFGFPSCHSLKRHTCCHLTLWSTKCLLCRSISLCFENLPFQKLFQCLWKTNFCGFPVNTMRNRARLTILDVWTQQIVVMTAWKMTVTHSQGETELVWDKAGWAWQQSTVEGDVHIIPARRQLVVEEWKGVWI